MDELRQQSCCMNESFAYGILSLFGAYLEVWFCINQTIALFNQISACFEPFRTLVREIRPNLWRNSRTISNESDPKAYRHLENADRKQFQ